MKVSKGRGSNLNILTWEWVYTYLANRYSWPESTQIRDVCAYCKNFLDQLAPETRHNIQEDINRAWRQERHRQKRKLSGRSTRSYSLSNDSLEKLAALAANSNQTLANTLEKIITQAYNKKLAKHAKTQSKPSNEVYYGDNDYLGSATNTDLK